MEKNDISPPSSPSSNGSTPSSDSQSSFDSNQVNIYYNFKIIFHILIILFKKPLSRLLLSNLDNKDTICNTNITIAPKPTSTSQNVPKLKILPAPIRSSCNANISSKTNNTLIHNNCKY